MRLFVIFAALIGVASTYGTSGLANGGQSYVRAKDVTEPILKETTTTPVLVESTTPAATPISSISTDATQPPLESSIEEKPQNELMPDTPLPPKPLPNDNDASQALPSKRRIITYDQRQEGQYNIRADLDNFMIVLIPPSPTDGLNILDLLTKSALRRNTQSSKNKRKHYSGLRAPQSTSTRYRQSLGNNDFSQSATYSAPQGNPAETGVTRNYFTTLQSSATQPIAIIDRTGPHTGSEFIEGRTPYHVDISANDDEQSRLHPESDHQVDVLPPPNYPHLIKPYHLEAEPTVIQALPPSDIRGASGEFLQLLNPGIVGNQINGRKRNRYRVSRAIRADNFLDTNRVASTNSLAFPTIRRAYLPIYRSEYSFGAANLYPPIDAPRYSSYLPLNDVSREIDTKSDDDVSQQNMQNTDIDDIAVPSNLTGDEELGIDLSNIGIMNTEVKDLLSDGMERCAPGSRRDSYGMCREVKGY